MKHHLKILGEYVGHLTIGALMFAALLFFGGVLNVLVHWATPIVGDNSFANLMKIVEKIILYTDATFIMYWAIYSTYTAIKEMIK
ncbi:hypothetical protein ACWYXK_08595 [Janthinobacterium lividum]|jgi:hypothetical protein|nr:MULTISPECIES: hypothetical protein [Janthinobacterium]MCC7696796.1 hypothetical protein [Janthinobacterium sp. EB271-G4-7A]MCC7712238.1 hypothetical protein [Janthinobacterium lividum]WQE27086.1 hypothetical protein U0004_19005 [Janthinobacterium lividum]